MQGTNQLAPLRMHISPPPSCGCSECDARTELLAGAHLLLQLVHAHKTPRGRNRMHAGVRWVEMLRRAEGKSTLRRLITKVSVEVNRAVALAPSLVQSICARAMHVRASGQCSNSDLNN